MQLMFHPQTPSHVIIVYGIPTKMSSRKQDYASLALSTSSDLHENFVVMHIPSFIYSRVYRYRNPLTTLIDPLPHLQTLLTLMPLIFFGKPAVLLHWNGMSLHDQSRPLSNRTTNWCPYVIEIHDKFIAVSNPLGYHRKDYLFHSIYLENVHIPLWSLILPSNILAT